MPKTISWDGREVNLSYPDEPTTFITFLECMLDDVYGRSRVKAAPRSILNIGANPGFFSLKARICFPGAVIHA